MAIQIDLWEDKDILFVHYSGCFDPEDDEKTDRQVAQICKEKGFTKILFDLTQLDGLPNLLESYQSGATLELLLLIDLNINRQMTFMNWLQKTAAFKSSIFTPLRTLLNGCRLTAIMLN